MASGQSDSFTSLRTAVYSSASSNMNISHGKLTKGEEKAIIYAAENTGGHFLDILSGLHKLKNIPEFQAVYPKLLQRVSTSENILQFMFCLLYFVPFTRFIAILYEVGFDILAASITDVMNGVPCRKIGPAKLTGSSVLQRFFYTQKSLLDDNGFKCRKTYLETLFYELTFELENSVDNAEENVGKLSIITWLRVQQHERSEDINEIITDMLNKLPQSVDKTIANIVYLGKSAVAYELDGDSIASEKYLSEAVSISELYSDPLTKSLLFHDTRYIHQLRFMRLKNEETRVKVQSDCVNALHFFSSFQQNDFCIFMWRILGLYLVHNLLKIGQNFEIDISEVSTSGEMAQATDVLSSLERCFQSGLPLEQRRKMIYFILRARLHEQLDGGKQTAVSYLSKAYCLRDDGTFFQVEERHLEHFKRRLLSSTSQSEARSGSHNSG